MGIHSSEKCSLNVRHICDQGYTIGAFSQETEIGVKVDNWLAPKAVAVVLNVSALDAGVGLMLASKEAVNEMILSLQRMRDTVWAPSVHLKN